MIKAKKDLGQNFLRNTDILKKIVGNNSLDVYDVLEVGPGQGDLTSEILQKKPRSFSAVEIDADLFPILEKRFSRKNMLVYHGDVLRMDILSKNKFTNFRHPVQVQCITKRMELDGLICHSGISVRDPGLDPVSYVDINSPEVRDDDTCVLAGIQKKKDFQILHDKEIHLHDYIVFGNIPYYITSPIIHHFLYGVTHPPKILVFTMQKEVADRILEKDGKHSVLSLSCNLIADIVKVCDISPHHFDPVPKVWSTCLRFTLRDGVDRNDLKKLLPFIQLGFSEKRKKLITNLAQKYSRENLQHTFQKLHIDKNIRAEDLGREYWGRILDGLL